jgi:cytochrome c oxidase cbb3-type subunit 1
MTTSTQAEKSAFADSMVLVGALGVAVCGLVLMIASPDSGMAFHGLIFLIAGVIASIAILQISFQDDASLETNANFMDGPVRVATIAAVFWGIAGFVVGDLIA